ncbi:MFS general substrate transporter [Rhypophila decipiens]|uniref:MFS general substrate transporter n=1 Tax=Rhypophila decipiens TaxID=261697 RepID=A0AAN7B874_9PEZI|nr:MFS general substrate transporter [Rhypophila decipiens]
MFMTSLSSHSVSMTDRKQGASSPSISEVKPQSQAQESPDNDGNPSQIPDGGKQAWLVVLGAWCVSFCSYGWINSIGTFQEYYQSGPLKEYSASQISWIPSLQIFFMSFVGPVIGRVYDRYGLRWLMVVGSVMHVFGLMMASLSSKYYQFMLSQGVCSAIGVAICFLSAISVITQWFDKRRGLAFGTLATGSSLGGVVFPIMLSRLIETVGYGWAMRVSAFLILALLGPSGAGGSIRSAQGRRNMLKPFRETQFLLLLVGLFLVPFGLYVPINYMPVASKGAGMTTDMAQNMVAIYNGASAVGRFSSGFISDKAGRYNVFCICCYIAGILILGMWVPVSEALPNAAAVSIAFAAMFGIFSGGYISLMASLVAAISPLEEIGYRNGITFFFSAIGGLTTNPIAGAILEAGGGNWVGLKTFAGVFMIAGTTFTLAVRIHRVGWGLTKVF